jgi:hypothetical protein
MSRTTAAATAAARALSVIGHPALLMPAVAGWDFAAFVR